MEGVVELLPKVIQYVSGSLLLVVLPGWVGYKLSRPIRGPLTRALGRFRLLSMSAKVFLSCFVLSWIVYAATKEGGSTNATPPMMSMPRRILHLVQEAISSNDIARGCRVAGTDGGSIVPMPAGSVTNEPLRWRGGFDWAFRVAPDGWWFPYRDGFLDGVTVVARGEVRPDVGTLYFPVPITNGVSLLPEASWNLLPDDEASVFSHAVTANGSLLLDWHNVLVGRDPNCPTNLQMELYRDGSFAWRMDGGSRFYLPVFPFDWDGDGLENSVDPEPLVPNPVDAHDTNPEWYGIVCSNVFTTTGTTGVPPVDEDLVQFKEGVNSNAYYFAEVVVERGPAPIYFKADRDSRLGSPVVVALPGETNRVPLLIGVEYTVTSTVPISVSAPDSMYAVVTTNNERNCMVRWPIGFEFDEDEDDSGRTCTVNVVPHDPGGTFSWSNGHHGGGTMLMATGPGSGCQCLSCSGNMVHYDCSEECECRRECTADGCFTAEDAQFTFSADGCRCGLHDPNFPHSVTSGSASFSAGFSCQAVLFEDAYDDSPNLRVGRKSTRVRLTVSACGGPLGGSFSLSSANLDKLSPVIGGISLPSSMVLLPNESFFSTCVYEAESTSDSADDVTVTGSFIENVTGDYWPADSRLTVVQVELECAKSAPANPCSHRHSFGVFEQVRLNHYPDCIPVDWTMSGCGTTNTSSEGYVGQNSEGTGWMLRCPLYGKNVGLKAAYQHVKWPFNIAVREPSGIKVRDPIRFDVFPRDVAGAGMRVPQYLQPDSVNFQEISVQEIPVEGESPINSGWFTNLPVYFQTHTTIAGAGVWSTPNESGFLGNDHACLDCGSTNLLSSGWQYLRIPWGWNKEVEKYLSKEDSRITCISLNNHDSFSGGECFRQVSAQYDSYDEVDADGTVSVSRFQLECRRPVNGNHSLINHSGQGGDL